MNHHFFLQLDRFLADSSFNNDAAVYQAFVDYIAACMPL